MRKPVILTVLIALIPAVAFASLYIMRMCEPIPWDPVFSIQQNHAVLITPETVEQEPVNPDLKRPFDPAMVRAGEELFLHEWTPHDPLAGGGDGLGPVYNATSCVACHFQNGVGGSGGLAENVTTFAIPRSKGPVHQGTLHAHSTLDREEYLNDLSPDLPHERAIPLYLLVSKEGALDAALMKIPRNGTISQRNSIALYGAGLIESIPNAAIFANSRQVREAGESGSKDRLRVLGRVSQVRSSRLGRFGWKAQSSRLAEFVRMACASELGLDNPGLHQDTPLFGPVVYPKQNDLTDFQCNQLTMFVASLPRPEERVPADPGVAAEAASGKRVFRAMGCANCHVPRLGDVDALYSDLLLHDMGNALAGGGSYFESSESPKSTEWRTPPLWGVADSAPYLHDGRAPTLEAAIRMHGGQGTDARERFEQASLSEQQQLLAFLRTLRAPASAKPHLSRTRALNHSNTRPLSPGDATPRVSASNNVRWNRHLNTNVIR